MKYNIEDRLEQLLHIIPEKKENAIHLEEISEALQLERSYCKLIIRYARNKGLRIVSGQGGYWISDDPGEMEAFSHRVSTSAKSSLAMLRKIIDPGGTPGQLELEDIETGSGTR